MVDLTLLFLHRNIVSISHFIKFEKKNLFSILKAVARALIVKKKKFAAHNAYSDKVYVVLEKKKMEMKTSFFLFLALCANPDAGAAMYVQTGCGEAKFSVCV